MKADFVLMIRIMTDAAGLIAAFRIVRTVSKG